MQTVWLQSQMVMLLVLPNIEEKKRRDFATNSGASWPWDIVKERNKKHQDSLDAITKEFLQVFRASLSPDQVTDLENNTLIRNCIGHSYFNTGQKIGDVLRYMPNPRAMPKMAKMFGMSENEIKETVQQQRFFKLPFNDESYFKTHWERMVRLEDCFRQLAAELDFPYESIC